jgi:hypothetical protein
MNPQGSEIEFAVNDRTVPGRIKHFPQTPLTNERTIVAEFDDVLSMATPSSHPYTNSSLSHEEMQQLFII